MSQACSKCFCEISGNAVQLKNGQVMCPACYQRAFPAPSQSAQPPRRIFINVTALLALVVVGTGGFIVFKAFSKYVEGERNAPRLSPEEEARMQAETESKRQATLAEQASTRERQMELTQDRIAAQKAESQAKQLQALADKERAAAEGKKREAERLRMEAEKLRLEEDAKERARLRELDLAKVRAEQEALARQRAEADAAAQRIADAEAARTALAEATRRLSQAEERRNEANRTIAACRTRIQGAQKTKDGLIAQYRTWGATTKVYIDPNDMTLSKWRDPNAGKASRTMRDQGNVTVTQDNSEQLQQNCKKFDDAEVEILTLSEKLNVAMSRIAAIDNECNALKSEVDAQRRKMGESIAAGPAPVAAPANLAEAGVPAPAAKVEPGKTVKVYVLKDGRRITAVKSMDAGDQISIKDQKGKMLVIEKTEIAETREEEVTTP